ncbi:glyoxalase [Sphingobacterium sp. Ag1]|uniref:VOC family protein n=1 Tax=Sphingobacterium sp. Ag1 TaxID=1643451 RepID=UPI000627FB88|nr:VOC family protein [Sphingobacterium sp. Ag1]KKO89549.1 glyoxalase [Sphingobacterium sp. Ag1]
MELKDNIVGFHHLSIKAQDFDKTIGFYENLGFIIVHEWSLPEFNLERCAMLFNASIGYYLEICDKNATIPTQGRRRIEGEEYVENALLHMCFTVEDAEDARIQAIAHGAQDLSDGVFQLILSQGKKDVFVRNSLVYSPNGEVIEFLERVDFS